MPRLSCLKLLLWVSGLLLLGESLFPQEVSNGESGKRFSTAAGSGIESAPFSRRKAPPTGSTLFEELPSARTGVHFEFKLPDVERHIHEIIHLSVHGGVCTGDYDGDGLADIYVTSPAGGNRLLHNLGDFRFEDLTEAAGVNDTNFWGTGGTFVDIDNDGDLDIYACGYKTPNRLYINQGRGADGRVRFLERAKAFGLDYQGASMTMAFADFDNDGDLDAYPPRPRGWPQAARYFAVGYGSSKGPFV